jgi:hypothetical protein
VSFDLLTIAPSSAVATNGTLTFPYPIGRTSANYIATGAILSVNGLQADLAQGGSTFSIAYGGTIVVTYLGATTIPALSRVTLQAPLYGTGVDSNVSPQAGINDMVGTLTGTVDGTMVDVAATAAATAGGATPTAAQVDTGIATAVSTIVTGINVQNKEVLTKLNAILAALRTGGVIS